MRSSSAHKQSSSQITVSENQHAQSSKVPLLSTAGFAVMLLLAQYSVVRKPIPRRAVLGGTKQSCVVLTTRKQLPCQGWRSRQEIPGLAWVVLTPVVLGPGSRPAPAAPASPTGEKASSGRHRHVDATYTCNLHTHTHTHTSPDHPKTFEFDRSRGSTVRACVQQDA